MSIPLLNEQVKYLFGMSIENMMVAADGLSEQIARATQRLIDCLLNDGKIMVCGHGGSAANCQHFSSSMLNYYEVERPSLPVINLCTDAATLTSFAKDSNYDQVFARPILSLGQERDVLLIVTTSGNSNTVLNALHAADERGMDTIALNGRDGGVLASHLGPEDIEIRVGASQSAQIREIHHFILNCFCGLIDQSLFGHGAA